MTSILPSPGEQAKYAVAVILTAFALFLSAIFWPVVENAPFLIPMAAVALSAWLGGLRPGMLSATLSLVSIDYFLIEPIHRVFTEPIEGLQLVIFGLVALLISWLEENRKRSAQSVRDLSMELRTILDSASEGITAQTVDGKVLFANPAIAEILDFDSPADLTGADSDSILERFEMFHESGEPLLPNELPRYRVVTSGKSESLQFKVRFHDTQAEKWLQLTSSPVLDETGSVRLFVHLTRDVTKEMQARLDREHLAAIVENSDDAIVSKDLSAVITSWNPGAERLYGYTAEEAIGQSIAVLFPEDLKPRELMLHKRIMDGERIKHYETKRLHKDGHTLHISLTISPVRNPRGDIVGFSTIERDITARKQRDAEIRQLSQLASHQNRRLETIIASIPGIVYVGSGDNDHGQQKMDYVSSYAEKMLGYSMDSWAKYDLASFWKEVVHPDDWEHAVAETNQLYEDDEPGSVQFRCITAAGETIHVEAHNAVLKNEEGERIGTCGVVMDVTDRVQARDRLIKLTQLAEQQRRHISNIVSNVPGIVYDSTVDTETGSQQMTFISDYTKTLLGYDAEQWKKDPYFWRKIIPNEDWESAQQKAEVSREMDAPGVAQYRCVRADGTTIDVESFFRFQEVEGELKSYGVIMDITDRKQREEQINRLNRQLRIQKRRMDNIIANVPGIVYEMEIDPHDKSQHINYLSPFAEKILGYTTDEMLAVENIFHEVVHPDDLDGFVKHSTLAGSEEMRSYQCRFKNKDGRLLHVEIYSRLIEDEPGMPIGAVGVVMDISKRKRIEVELEAYMENLTRSNHDLEQFAYVASHDLQEPLRKITSYLQLIERRYSDKLDDDGREFIGYTVDGATRMKTLINDLLMYSRVQRNRDDFEKTSLQDVIDGVLANLEFLLQENNAEITCDDMPVLCANKTQMVQLFQNLISNGIKFRGEDPPRIHIGAEKRGTRWQFCVKDNGIGIEPKYFERIFEIFQRLHGRKDFSGTGIGLAICKKIVDNHAGRIWVESEPNQGTTFFFTLADTAQGD